jgi:hypothetical protein
MDFMEINPESVRLMEVDCDCMILVLLTLTHLVLLRECQSVTETSRPGKRDPLIMSHLEVISSCILLLHLEISWKYQSIPA